MLQEQMVFSERGDEPGAEMPARAKAKNRCAYVISFSETPEAHLPAIG
jgi:hypothetical protein